MKIDVVEKPFLQNERYFEIVERKGIGHPDTVADGVAEAISNEYSKYCLDNFGAVLHHNVDKVYVRGGSCKVGFGVAEVNDPITIYLNGRMSNRFGDHKIDTKELQIKTAKQYIQSVIPNLNINKDLKFVFNTSTSSKLPFWFKPRSLDDLPEHYSAKANDTAVTVASYPHSDLERLTLMAEKFFYDDDVVPRFGYLGQDIKIMAERVGKKITMTLCVPFLGSQVTSYDDYKEKYAQLIGELEGYLKKEAGSSYQLNILINTQDRNAKNPPVGLYITASGSALDFGEEGVVGRGNRSDGFIASDRPSTVEAPYGKNPVYHVGKVYNYLTNKVAQELSEVLAQEVEVTIVTNTGDKIAEPHTVFVAVKNTAPINKKEIEDVIKRTIEDTDWVKEIIEKEYFVPKEVIRKIK